MTSRLPFIRSEHSERGLDGWPIKKNSNVSFSLDNGCINVSGLDPAQVQAVLIAVLTALCTSAEGHVLIENGEVSRRE